jgi:hypothetical protein
VKSRNTIRGFLNPETENQTKRHEIVKPRNNREFFGTQNEVEKCCINPKCVVHADNLKHSNRDAIHTYQKIVSLSYLSARLIANISCFLRLQCKAPSIRRSVLTTRTTFNTLGRLPYFPLKGKYAESMPI